MRVRHFVPLAALVALLVPVGASASTMIDRNAKGVSLKVNGAGQALVSYTARGKRWNVLAWGAVNAVPPTPGKKQVDFKLDYSGGWGTYKKDVWKTFANTCARLHRAPARLAGRRAARRRTAATGPCRPGSGCCRTTVSRRSRSRPSGSSGSRTGRAICRS